MIKAASFGKFLNFLIALRLVGTLGMLATVVAGAFGFGESVKLYSAVGGAFLGVALKISHRIS